MTTLNLKAVASAFAALAVTMRDELDLRRCHQRRARPARLAAAASWPPSVPWYARSPEHSDGPAVGRQPADLPAAA